MVKSYTYIATPPGATIKEQLLDRGLSQKEFSVRMDMSEKHISKLINGEVQLTHDVANRLEMVLGLPASFWNNLEAIYREKIIKVKSENEMDEDKEIAKKIPYLEMSKYGWVDETDDSIQMVVNLRKYFEVVNLSIIKDMQLSRIACRRLEYTDKNNFALLAWAQKAKIEARSVNVSAINLKKLENKLTEIKMMINLDSTDIFSQLEEILADCGIVLTFLPYLDELAIHGATFCDGNKIVVALTKYDENNSEFWFNLFHELGHIILGHIYQVNGTNENDEMDADNFAQEMLLITNNE